MQSFSSWISERFPLNAIIILLGAVLGRQEKDEAYLFGDLTSATLVSKACLEGVAVEVEEVCDCMRR